VAYVPILNQLEAALARFTGRGGGSATLSMEAAVAVLREKHDIVLGILHGHEWSSTSPTRTAHYESIARTAGWLSRDEARRSRFLDHSLGLGKAFALAGAPPAAAELRDDVEYLLSVRGVLIKLGADEPLVGGRHQDLDSVLTNLVNSALESDEVIDIYAQLGRKRPDLSLLSDEFLASVTQKPQRNLQVELLRKILNDEIRSVARRNVVRGKTLTELINGVILKYQNRALTEAEIISELVELARVVREEQQRGQRHGLSDTELAFYDAVTQNVSAVAELGDRTLKAIARELVTAVRESATIDWRDRESARAEMRVKIKTLLRRHRYPPDGEESATQLVIEQARLFADEWSS